MVGQPFSTADQVVLCCFGLELTGERSAEDLRRALHKAGFNGPLARHTLHTSALLIRVGRSTYRIKSFEA